MLELPGGAVVARRHDVQVRIRTGEKDADAYLAQTEKKRSMEWAKEKR